MSRSPRSLPPIAGLVCCLYGGSAAAAQICRPDSIPPTTPTSRFILSADRSVVTDQRTGLVWKRCPEGLSGGDCGQGSAEKFDWQAALQRAAAVRAAGYAGQHDWRLPNAKELRSILESQCFQPAINQRLFPNVPVETVPGQGATSQFWSSTPDSRQDGSAWYVNFGGGFPAAGLPKDTPAFVRLVRGPDVPP